MRRASGNHPDLEQRFHYRYQAVFLAREAVKLMPNNSDETARVLYAAGCWLKNRDAQTADIFYKALVRRNRETALGDAADRQRWFPELDEKGNPIPKLKFMEDQTPLQVPTVQPKPNPRPSPPKTG